MAIEITKNHPLDQLNTFGIAGTASAFCEVSSESELLEAIQNAPLPIYTLGGGSNMLITKDLPWFVIHNCIMGKEVIRKFKNRAWVKIGGGENWHEVVQWTLSQDLGGIENLSLIPGTAGAAPVQNIGAYGVELKDVFVRLEAIHLQTGKKRTFNRTDCGFGYRDSVFKNELKGTYFITSVTLSLSLPPHRIKTSYGAIRAQLESAGVKSPTIQDVSKAVIAIRSSKLPDPAQIGNSGSFFKNPVVSASFFEALKERFPEAPSYVLPDDNVKVPAAWLIQSCGWKGKQKGRVGSYKNQPLVLVNHGGASGQELLDFAMEIIASVKSRFGIQLEPEVNILP